MGKILYRYRKFDCSEETDYNSTGQMIQTEKWKFEAFEGLIHPSSPLYFNDPYDCDLCFQPEVIKFLTTGETLIHLLERKFKRRLKRYEKDILIYSDDKERQFKTILEAHGIHLADTWDQILLKSIDNSYRDKIKDAVRVVCLSELNNSILMWSHYADNHKGYCIEYNFDDSDDFYDCIYPVVYNKDRHVISKEEVAKEKGWAYKCVCRKSEVWSYEKEWRIVIPNFDLNNLGVKINMYLNKNIKAFYLGAKCDEKYRNEIVKFAKDKGILVYQMALSSNTYELQAQKIV